MAGDNNLWVVVPVVLPTEPVVAPISVTRIGNNTPEYGAGSLITAPLSATQFWYDMWFGDPNSPLYVWLPLKAKPYNINDRQQEKYGNTAMWEAITQKPVTPIEQKWNTTGDVLDQSNQILKDKLSKIWDNIGDSWNNYSKAVNEPNKEDKSPWINKNVVAPLGVVGNVIAGGLGAAWAIAENVRDKTKQFVTNKTMTPQEQWVYNQQMIKKQNEKQIAAANEETLWTTKFAQDNIAVGDDIQAKATLEADKIKKEQWQKIQDTITAVSKQEEIDANFVVKQKEIDFLKQEAKLKKDTVAQQEIVDKQKKLEEDHQFEIQKNTFHYVTGKDITATNMWDLQQQIVDEFKLKDASEIPAALDTKQKAKYQEAVVADKQLKQISEKLMWAAIKNVEWTNTEVYNKFFQNNWLVLNDNDTATLTQSLYGKWVADELVKAKLDWPEATNAFFQKWSKINQLWLTTLETMWINWWIQWAVIGKERFFDAISSPQFEAVKKDILWLDLNTLVDENNNFSSVKFAEAIAGLDSFKAYQDLVGESANAARNEKLWTTNRWDNWATRSIQIAWWLVDDLWTNANTRIFQPYAQALSYINKEKYNNPYLMLIPGTEWINVLWESIYKNVFDTYIKDIKREDIGYAQDSWNTVSDTIDSTYKTLTSNPGKAAAIAASSYIAMWAVLTKAPKVIEFVETLDNIAHPVWRNILKWATYWFSNTIESLPLNLVMDTAFATPWQNMAWWLADPFMGFASVLSDMNSWRLITRIQKDISAYKKEATEVMHLAADTVPFQDFVINKIQSNYWYLITWAEKWWVSVIDYLWIWWKNIIWNDTSRIIAKSIANNMEKSLKDANLSQIIAGAALNEKLTWIKEYTPESITVLAKSYAEKWGELARTIKDNLVAKWEYTDFNFLRDMTAAQSNNMQTIATLQIKKMKDMELAKTGIFKWVEATYKKINEKIDDIISTGKPAEIEKAKLAKMDIDEWLWIQYQMPYLVASTALSESIAKSQMRFVNAITSAWMARDKTLVSSITIPQEIIDAGGDIEKITQLVYANVSDYEKIWVKTYNVKDYVVENEILLKASLGEEKYNRFSTLIDTISKINNWEINILELPTTMQEAVKQVGWFVTQTELWGKNKFIIWVIWTLSENALSTEKNIKSYFNVLCHEIGHNILFSLKKWVRDIMLVDIEKAFSESVNLEQTVKSMIDVSEERRNYLYNLYKFSDKSQFYEEVAADVVAGSLVDYINGVSKSKLSPWKSIYEKILQWKYNFNVWDKTTVWMVSKLFVDAIAGMRKFMWWVEDSPLNNTRVILHMIADNIVTGNLAWTKDNALWNMKKFWYLKFEGIEEATYDFTKAKIWTRNVEMVPINILDKYKEFDRAVTPWISSPDYIDGLRYNIETYWIKEPLILAYYKWDKTARLIEWNTRLMIAKEMKTNELPVRVIRYEWKWWEWAISVRWAIENEHGFVPEDLLPSDIWINQKLLLREGQKPIWADYFTDITARERFNIPELKLLSSQWSDRNVFDLGKGQILKVAKTARWLSQNAQASWDLAEAGIIPKIFERWDNYIVFEKVTTFQEINNKIMELRRSDFWKDWKIVFQEVWTPRHNEFMQRANELESTLRDFNRLNYTADKAQEFSHMVNRNEDVVWAEEFLNELWRWHLMNYELDKFGRGDVRLENLGIKDGKVILIDEWTIDLTSTLIRHRWVDSMSDAEFRRIYDESKAFKKKMGDSDSYTYFYKQEKKASAYANNADKVDSANDGNIFATAELTTPADIRMAIMNKSATAEELGNQIPIIFKYDVALYGQIVDGLDDTGRAVFHEALEIASQKHNLAIWTIRQVYSEAGGYIDLTKKIGWYTFVDALNNVGVWITRQWATERAGWDLIKFLPEDVYANIVTNLMNDTLQWDYFTTAVNAKISQALDLLVWPKPSLGEQYLWLIDVVKKRIYDMAITWWLSEEKAIDLSKDIVSRLVVWWPSYLRTLQENIQNIAENPKMFIEELAYGLTKKNRTYAGDEFKIEYQKILDSFQDVNVQNWEKYAEIFGKELEKDQLQRARYTRQYYNYLSERTNSYILNAIKEWTLTKINMNSEQFSIFINKISRKWSVYEDLIREKVMALWLDKETTYGTDWFDMMNIPPYNTTQELINIYKTILEANKDNIILKKVRYQPMKKFLEQLETVGISKTDNARMIAKYNKDFNSIGWATNLSKYFDDLVGAEEARQLFNTREANILWQFAPTSTHEYKLWLQSLNSPKMDALSKDLWELLTLHNNMVEDAKEVGLDIAVGSLFNAKITNNPFRELFDFNGADASIKLIWKLNNRFETQFRYEYEENILKSKNWFLKNALLSTIGGIVNPITAAKYDDRLKKIFFESVDAMEKWNFMFKGSALEAYALSKWFKWKYISSWLFFDNFVKDINKMVGKWRITFRDISNDILANYEYRYFKSRAQTFVWWINQKYAIWDAEYKTLIDSYVDILWRRKHDKRGLFTFEQLDRILWDINDSFEKNWIFLGSLRPETKNMNKVEWLKWHWYGMTTEDIAYAKNKAGVFNPNMFNNILYNAYAQTNQAYWFIDGIIKLYKSGEKSLIKTQYTLFYNMLLWVPSWLQQVFNNNIKVVANTIAEVWSVNVLQADEFLSLIDNIYPVQTIGFGDSKIWAMVRWELQGDVLESATKKWAAKKFWEFIDDVLTNTSALALWDRVAEWSVKKLSLNAAFNKYGYTSKGANDFIQRTIEISNKLNSEWFITLVKWEWDINSYMSFKNFLLKWDKEIESTITYRVNKEVMAGNITAEEWAKRIKNIMATKKEIAITKDIVEDIRTNFQVFYQLSNKPQMISNLLWWYAGASNMRFFNWASRKAWEYAYQLANAVITKDSKLITQIGIQLGMEAMTTAKYYLFIDNVSNQEWGWGISASQFAMTMFLPAVLFSMLSLKLGPALADIAWDGIKSMFRWPEDASTYAARIAMEWWTISERFIDEIANAISGVTKRPQSSTAFRVSNISRMRNGLTWLSEKWNVSDALGIKTGIGYVTYMAEHMIGEIAQSRISRFDTNTNGWYNTYMWYKQTDILINMMMNANIDNKSLNLTKLLNYSYKIDPSKWLSSWFWGIWWYSKDKKFELIAEDKYMKENGYYQLIYWWTDVRTILGNAEWMIKEPDIKAFNDANWTNYSTPTGTGWLENIDVDFFNSLEWWTAWQKNQNMVTANAALSLGKKSILWNFLLWHLDPSKWGVDQKQLYAMWRWVTSKETAAKIDRFNRLVGEIDAAAVLNPSMLKSTYLTDPAAWQWIISDGLNEFWDSIFLAASLKWLVSANVKLMEMDKAKEFGKNRKTDKDAVKNKLDIIDSDAKFKLDLAAANWNTMLQANRTIGKDVLLLAMNADTKSPLKVMLNDNIGIGIPLMANVFQKQIASQWIASFWINNKATDILTYVRRWYDNATVDKKEEQLIKIMWFMKDMLDYVDDASKWDQSFNTNMRIWLISASLSHLEELKKESAKLGNGFWENIAPDVSNFLKRVTVSTTVEDDKIKAAVEAAIYNKTWWSRRHPAAEDFAKLNFKLNKFSDFKTDFLRYVMKEQPLEHITYKFDGSTKIIPIRESALEARPIDTKNQFIKLLQPESLKTPDISVETIKTTRASKKYTGKAIKGSNIYTVKTTRWAKKK